MIGDVIDFIKNNWGEIVGVITALSIFIQVSPLKINPWSIIFGWIGSEINKEIKNEITSLKEEVKICGAGLTNVTGENDKRRIQDLRWAILNFSHDLRCGQEYDRYSFDHIYECDIEYTNLLEKYGMTNGQTTAAMEVINEAYKQLNK